MTDGSPTVADLNVAKIWKDKIRAEDENYNQWEKRFRCDDLEDYFEGEQWKNENAPDEYKKYVINLFFSSIEVKIPSMIFTTPSFTVAPRPYESDFDETEAYAKARLKEDVINSYVLDDRNKFGAEIEQCAYDTFFRFAVIETGYSANWVENPNADKPIYDEKAEPNFDGNLPIKKQPKKLPKDERIYLKTIQPKTFRASGIGTRYLDKCDWVGYYEFFRTEDLKNNPDLSFRAELDSNRNKHTYSFGNEDLSNKGSLTKVWHIWDIRSKERLLIEDGTGLILKRAKYYKLPFRIFAPIPRAKSRSVYPIPLAFNWIHPQSEINETKEAMRVHRRKFKRKYLIRDGTFENDTEFVKLVNGPDGAFAKTTTEPATAIIPLPIAPMDTVSRDSLVTSRDDMNIISATTAEQRGEGDRVTATAAQISNNKAEIRESRLREQFAKFLCAVASDILCLHAEKLTEPFWIKRFADSPMTIGAEMPQLQYRWQQIVSDEIEGDDFDIDVKVTSLSPIANDEEKKKLFEFLSVLNTYPQLAFSPLLIQEVMDRIGYRNTKVAQQFIQMAMMQMVIMGQQMQEQGAAMAQQNVQQSTGPAKDQAVNQVQNAGRIQ